MSCLVSNGDGSTALKPPHLSLNGTNVRHFQNVPSAHVLDSVEISNKENYRIPALHTLKDIRSPMSPCRRTSRVQGGARKVSGRKRLLRVS